MIKLFDPHVTNDEIEAAKQVILSHNWASGAGLNKVKEFENQFSAYLGSKTVVAVNSGTAALHLALSMVGVQGKDVLVPSLSFVSTAHAAVYSGGNPIFVDVEEDTLCMDSNDLPSKIQSGKSSVIVPVHFGGLTCDMKKIIKFSKDNDLKIIDDAAHACGSKYNGERIGGFSDIMTCFSFHPVKNLSMPTGGAISINYKSAEGYKKKLNSMRWCGIDSRQNLSYDVTSIAPNYYMNEISAAIGLVQLKKLDRLNSRRQEIAKRYTSEIKIRHKMPYRNDCVYHLYWIAIDKREKLIRDLTIRGIEVGTHYKPIHTMSAYHNKSNQAKIPVTDEVGKKVVTLPIHPNLTDDDITYIIKSVNAFQ
jgi:perosamine synthetase